MEQVSRKQRVVLDADFFRHTTDHENNTQLLEKLLNEASYYPIIHEYVAKVELQNNAFLAKMISEHKIEIVSDNEYLQDEDHDYREYFSIVYERLNLVPLGEEDVMTYGYDGNHPHESLGEIRSIYMAYKMGLPIFLSDDGGSVLAAKYIDSKKSSVQVIKLYELIKMNVNSGGSICWKDIKVTIPKVYINDKEKCEELCSLVQNRN